MQGKQSASVRYGIFQNASGRRHIHAPHVRTPTHTNVTLPRRVTTHNRNHTFPGYGSLDGNARVMTPDDIRREAWCKAPMRHGYPPSLQTPAPKRGRRKGEREDTHGASQLPGIGHQRRPKLGNIHNSTPRWWSSTVQVPHDLMDIIWYVQSKHSHPGLWTSHMIGRGTLPTQSKSLHPYWICEKGGSLGL